MLRIVWFKTKCPQAALGAFSRSVPPPKVLWQFFSLLNVKQITKKNIVIKMLAKQNFWTKNLVKKGIGPEILSAKNNYKGNFDFVLKYSCLKKIMVQISVCRTSQTPKFTNLAYSNIRFNPKHKIRDNFKNISDILIYTFSAAARWAEVVIMSKSFVHICTGCPVERFTPLQLLW